MKTTSLILLALLLASSPSMARTIQADPDPDAKDEMEDAQPEFELGADSKVFSEAYEQADRIVSIAKRKERVALQLNNIATYYLYSEKQIDHAQYFYLRSQELFKQIGNVYGIAMTTYNQGVALRAEKDIVGACEKTIEALPIAEKAAANKRYNPKGSAALLESVRKFNKANCGSGT